MQGTTRFEMAVDEAGKPTSCAVFKSSGHDLLDRRACDVLMSRAQFVPAKDETGKPVASVWRHLVVWTPVDADESRRNRAGYVGVGVRVKFDRVGVVTKCEAVPLPSVSKLTPEQADMCRTMGTAQVFEALLDRTTAGLSNATFRVWKESRHAGIRLSSSEPVRRVLAHVEFDQTDEGAITWCEVKVAPVIPLIGLEGTDLCGPRAFGVNRSGGGGQVQDIIYDVVAMPR